MAKKKFYVVWKGRETGIFMNWSDCEAQITAFPGALYKSFGSMAEAELAFKNPPLGKTSNNLAPRQKSSGSKPLTKPTLSVDAACSGNPGVMEYQGVITATKEQVFHKKFPLGTNNIGEFLAIVHGLALLKQKGSSMPIYTDSVNAMLWVEKKKCRTKLEQNAETKELFEVISRAELWLQNNTYTTQILKWDTKNWGEIPADFGRK